MNDNEMFYGASAEIFRTAEILRRNMTPAESKLWDTLKDTKRICQLNCGGRLLRKRENNLMKKKEHLLSRITINSKIMVGKPTIRGMRITVEQLLRSRSAGISEKELLEEYPVEDTVGNGLQVGHQRQQLHVVASGGPG